MLEEECVAEVIDPQTLAPANEGEEGELVITTLGRVHSPVVRYRTGDRVKVGTKACGCGRPWMWCEGGVLGRTDDMMVIKGNNFYPSMIEAIVRDFEEVNEFQAVFDTRRPGEMVLRLELRTGSKCQAVKDKVSERFRDQYQFKPEIEVVSAGTLPKSEMKSRRVVVIK